VPQCPTGTAAADCTHRLVGTQLIPDEHVYLVALKSHCHSGTCITIQVGGASLCALSLAFLPAFIAVLCSSLPPSCSAVCCIVNSIRSFHHQSMESEGKLTV
jgi:hypothetical protein